MSLCSDCQKIFKRTGVKEKLCPDCNQKHREKGYAKLRLRVKLQNLTKKNSKPICTDCKKIFVRTGAKEKLCPDCNLKHREIGWGKSREKLRKIREAKQNGN